MQILLPCYSAIYNMEQWDNLEWLSESFGFKTTRGLAEANGFKSIDQLSSAPAIMLPGWKFFTARDSDSLERIDEMFDLPRGSSRAVGRVYRPDARIPYPGETVAVPIESGRIKLTRRKKKV